MSPTLAVRRLTSLAAAAGLILALASGALVPAAGAAGSAPPVPIAEQGRFLTNLSAPILTPGSEGTVSFSLSNPTATPLAGVQLTLEVYAFTPAPGGAAGPVPNGSIAFPTPSGQGSADHVSLAFGSMAAGDAPVRVALPVSASSGAPEGGYAIRTSITYLVNGSAGTLSSRGHFSLEQWSAATTPGGAGTAPTLNLTRLGVQGILPETAVGVAADHWSAPITALAVGGVVLGVAGALVYVRRGPGSSSGARSAPPPQSAPSAVGK